MVNLKSCPFCGGSAFLEYTKSYKSEYFIFVRCGVGRAMSKTYKSESEPVLSESEPICKLAMSAWNLRENEC